MLHTCESEAMRGCARHNIHTHTQHAVVFGVHTRAGFRTNSIIYTLLIPVFILLGCAVSTVLLVHHVPLTVLHVSVQNARALFILLRFMCAHASTLSGRVESSCGCNPCSESIALPTQFIELCNVFCAVFRCVAAVVVVDIGARRAVLRIGIMSRTEET